MSDPIEFRTRDHPEANGRKPEAGESAWTLTFPLEDGTILRVHYGAECYEHISQMLLDMMANTPSYDDGSTGGH